MTVQIEGLGYDEDENVASPDLASADNDADPRSLLSLNLSVENTTLPKEANSLWASFKLDAAQNTSPADRLPTDFILVVDTSAAMKREGKLSTVCFTIQRLLEMLNDGDRVALVTFSDTASLVLDLDYATIDRQEQLLSALREIRAAGDSNMGDGLFRALSVAAAREEKPPIAQVLLMTDGIISRGMNHTRIIQTLDTEQVDENLSIHCFGYGHEHASAALQAIAFRSPGGMYYYIADRAKLENILQECLVNSFAALAHTVRVYLNAFDGCRFVKICTKVPFKTVTSMKQYHSSLGCVYEGSTRSFLLRLSLRGMRSDCQHPLFQVSVSYTSALDQRRYRITKQVVAQRGTTPRSLPVNAELDRQINRVMSAEAIDKAIVSASEKNFGTAEQIIEYAIQKIRSSHTSGDTYCADLIADLRDCRKCVGNQEQFTGSGAHEALQYSTMYNRERSVGIRSSKVNRSAGYGYPCSQPKELGPDLDNEVVSIRLLPGYY